MGYQVRSRVPNMRFCAPALGSISNCCTALGKNVNVGPLPVTLIKECPLGTLDTVSLTQIMAPD